ncbi:MAG: alpha/beta hydrolase [Candidatus Theseobacter exili]|nr:alpha/beta hydrolase [Candidatus Theseobacter exili]
MRSDSRQKLIEVRKYGSSGEPVIVLHGGPGAAGYMQPVAKELGKEFRVYEPFQRESGKERLTVACHVKDINDLIKSYCSRQKPAIVGHSWGAMLALAYAAEYPDNISALALVGCGTFDKASRQQMEKVRNERMTDNIKNHMKRLTEKIEYTDQRLCAMGQLMQKIDSYNLISSGGKIERCDARAHRESWQDMILLQDTDVYPAAFAKITVPVIMIHGTHDPHPGKMIETNLKGHIPQLEYFQLEKCGHYPWLEKAVKDKFYAFLKDWLLLQNKTI